MLYLIAFGSIFGVWTLLRILGGERESRLQIVRITIEAEAAALEKADGKR